MQKTVLILHGWGLFGEKYKDLRSILEKNGFKVFAPDFPGFGKEPMTKPAMTIDDYVLFLEKFYKQHNIKKAYIIAHSFGGRVTAKFAALQPEKIEKIVFTGSPLIREKLTLKKRIISFTARSLKVFMHFLPKKLHRTLQWIIYRSIGEWDYYKADTLRETFKNVINEDASVYISKIKNPVLNIWGSHDTMVPAYIGKQITARITNAKYESISDAGHKIPYSHPKEFAQHVISFFNI